MIHFTAIVFFVSILTFRSNLNCSAIRTGQNLNNRHVSQMIKDETHLNSIEYPTKRNLSTNFQSKTDLKLSRPSFRDSRGSIKTEIEAGAEAKRLYRDMLKKRNVTLSDKELELIINYYYNLAQTIVNARIYKSNVYNVYECGADINKNYDNSTYATFISDYQKQGAFLLYHIERGPDYPYFITKKTKRIEDSPNDFLHQFLFTKACLALGLNVPEMYSNVLLQYVKDAEAYCNDYRGQIRENKSDKLVPYPTLPYIDFAYIDILYCNNDNTVLNCKQTRRGNRYLTYSRVTYKNRGVPDETDRKYSKEGERGWQKIFSSRQVEAKNVPFDKVKNILKSIQSPASEKPSKRLAIGNFDGLKLKKLKKNSRYRFTMKPESHLPHLD